MGGAEGSLMEPDGWTPQVSRRDGASARRSYDGIMNDTAVN